MYPTDPPSPRRQSPSRLPDELSQTLAEPDVAPGEQGNLIPRLSALPTDNSNDWVLSSRQPVDTVPEPLMEIPPEPSNTPAASIDFSKAPRLAQSPHSVDTGPGSPNRKSLRERNISEIEPFYDRERDNDMREFAVEKAKEFDIVLAPKVATDRVFPQITLAWEASNFFYHPLYFSDPALERYGHTHPHLLQPAASIARAGIQFIFLPYQMVIDPPCEEVYALGYYRPGECAPKLHYQPPLNAEAAVVEAGVITGLFFIIP